MPSWAPRSSSRRAPGEAPSGAAKETAADPLEIDLEFTLWLQLLGLLVAIGLGLRRRLAEDYQLIATERRNTLRQAAWIERGVGRGESAVTRTAGRQEAVMRTMRTIVEDEYRFLESLFQEALRGYRTRAGAAAGDCPVPALPELEDVIHHFVEPELQRLAQPTTASVPIPQPPPPPTIPDPPVREARAAPAYAPPTTPPRRRTAPAPDDRHDAADPYRTSPAHTSQAQPDERRTRPPTPEFDDRDMAAPDPTELDDHYVAPPTPTELDDHYIAPPTYSAPPVASEFDDHASDPTRPGPIEDAVQPSAVGERVRRPARDPAAVSTAVDAAGPASAEQRRNRIPRTDSEACSQITGRPIATRRGRAGRPQARPRPWSLTRSPGRTRRDGCRRRCGDRFATAVGGGRTQRRPRHPAAARAPPRSAARAPARAASRATAPAPPPAPSAK